MTTELEFKDYKDLKCSCCGEISKTEEWIDTEVPCEDCGSHDAIRCPKCDESFDSVWGYDKIIEATKEPTNETPTK